MWQVKKPEKKACIMSIKLVTTYSVVSQSKYISLFLPGCCLCKHSTPSLKVAFNIKILESEQWHPRYITPLRNGWHKTSVTVMVGLKLGLLQWNYMKY